MTDPTLVIAVDGPAGSGKSTVSRRVADRLGLSHLDTGAFYRAAALAAVRAGVDLADEAAVEPVVAGAAIDQEAGMTTLDGSDVSDAIRDEAITQASSVVAAHPRVRAVLVARQREWVARHGGRAVVEGRDIGSVVLPDADLKVYLTADPEERARRRARETSADLSRVGEAIAARDRRDTTRRASPLTAAEGAVEIDTTRLGIDEVVDEVLRRLV